MKGISFFAKSLLYSCSRNKIAFLLSGTDFGSYFQTLIEGHFAIRAFKLPIFRREIKITAAHQTGALAKRCLNVCGKRRAFLLKEPQGCVMIAALFTDLALALLINVVLFVPAFALKTDKLTDASYSLTFILLSIRAFSSSNGSTASQLLLAMILLWAFRLGVFLWMRINRLGRDKRFDDIRIHAMRFFGFWVLQGLSVWLIMLPSLLFWKATEHHMELLAVFGIVIWASGLMIESIADYQKAKFYRTQNLQQRWITTGLWRYSRHPNYFGEILVWLGIYLFTINAFTWPIALFALISPVYITILLRFVSGVPKLEKSADAKFGHLPNYRAYKRSTNCLLLWFPKK